MELKIKAYAKINLTLDITGKRSDGYHEVKMIMQSVSLFDIVTLSGNSSGNITVSCSHPDVPCDERNIVVKCARLFFERYGKSCKGLHIDIDKNIPTQAGLAGGSADGAAVLAGLNRMYGEPFNLSELEEIGSRVGSDIPFCVRGGTVLAEGTGTELTNLKSMPMCHIVLVKPPVGISTAQAYGAVDSREFVPECATDKMLDVLDDIEEIGKNLRNDFEDTLDIEELLNLKKELSEADSSLGGCMTGSGSTVFGIFSHREKAVKCAGSFNGRYSDVFVAEPTDCGTEIF